MKQLLLFVILTFSTAVSIMAQSCAITLELTNQHQIDTLSAATKSCTIQGIIVSGSGIINLQGLSGIEKIDGPLYIYGNPDLLNLNGLSGLKNVVGEIDINNNPKITDLEGLSSLTTVGSNVRVVSNDALSDIRGLRNLTTIPGFLSVGQNISLPSLTGLEGITTINGAVAFGKNPLVTNLDPLKNLTSIGGFLYIGFNPALTSISGLINLRTVSNYINFEENDALTTLAGLDSLNFSTPYYLKIIGNDFLSFCSVKSMCDFVSRRTEFIIQGNANGCGSADQIETICASLPVELTSFSAANNREGNAIKWETAWEVNNAGFELHKSRDSKSFEVLAFVPGNGSSKENGQYEYQDTTPYPMTYYRLKQMDYDGTYAFSKIVAVKDNFSQFRPHADAINIFPNPVKDKLTIKVQNLNQPFSIRNFDGQTIKSGKVIPAEPINVSEMPNGLYLLTVGSETFKILIRN